MHNDADDYEFPGSLPLDSARWVVSTIPHLDTSRTLARSLERWGYQGKVAVTAHSSSAREQLARDVDEGRIDRVLNPFEDAGKTTVRACYRQPEMEPVAEAARDAGSGLRRLKWQEPQPVRA